MNKPGTASIISTVALVLSGCGSGGPNPTFSSPTVTPTPIPTATYTLSGVVSEMTSNGPEPLEGARVVDNAFGQTAVTDINGRYSIPGLPAMSHSVSIAKDGYLTETKTVTMAGNTRLDIELDRLVFYILSGIVFEVTPGGQVPIEGVQIYCDSCGSPVGHTYVYTDADGFYRLPWSTNGVHPLLVTKAGYEIFDPSGPLRDPFGGINATVQGDTRFDVRLVKR